MVGEGRMFAEVRQMQELTLPWQIDYTGFDPYSATNPLSSGHWWSHGIGGTLRARRGDCGCSPVNRCEAAHTHTHTHTHDTGHLF